MGNNKTPFLVAALLHFIISCSGQQMLDKNAEMKRLVDQELKNQENARSGNKNPSVTVISDARRVAQVRKETEAKIALQKSEEIAEEKKKSIAEKYKLGDKTVVPEMIEILKSKDETKKHDVMSHLGKNYDDPDGYHITEPVILDLIMQDVDNPFFEKDAVQLAGINELPGYEEKFETRLLSGKSTDAGRIFFWLGKSGKSRKALDYLALQVSDNKVTSADVDGYITGLEYFGKNNPAVRPEVGNIALLIYQKRLISDDRFEDLKNSVTTTDAAEGLLNCLFEYGDKQVIPIAKDIAARKIRLVEPVKALIRLEGPQHLNKVYQYLNNEEDFFTGLSLAEVIDRKYVDDKMLKDILIQFAKRKEIPDYLIDRIVQTFIDLNAADYLKNAAAITSNPKVASRLEKRYASLQIPAETIISNLVNRGLIRKRPDAEAIQKAKKEAGNDPLSFVYEILSSQHLYFNFDTETDALPVDYDKLLGRFSEQSECVLKDMQVWMEVKENKATKGYDYTITVLYKDKAFIAKPQDMGDWYDMMTVNTILVKVLESSGSPKRFVAIESGDQTGQYIFGVPSAVQQVLKTYKG